MAQYYKVNFPPIVKDPKGACAVTVQVIGSPSTTYRSPICRDDTEVDVVFGCGEVVTDPKKDGTSWKYACKDGVKSYSFTCPKGDAATIDVSCDFTPDPDIPIPSFFLQKGFIFVVILVLFVLAAGFLTHKYGHGHK